MKSSRVLILVAALALVAAACSSDSGGSADNAGSPSTTSAPAATAATAPTTSPTTAPVPADGTAILGLHVARVVFGPDGYVEISNTGDVEVSLDGLWLCQFPTYLPLSGSIAAGEVLQISAADIGGLSADGGEAALYSDKQFDSPTAILDYVGWGTGGKRGEVAALAGIWPQGVTVSAPPDFIELGGAPGDPEAWG